MGRRVKSSIAIALVAFCLHGCGSPGTEGGAPSLPDVKVCLRLKQIGSINDHDGDDYFIWHSQGEHEGLQGYRFLSGQLHIASSGSDECDINVKQIAAYRVTQDWNAVLLEVMEMLTEEAQKAGVTLAERSATREIGHAGNFLARQLVVEDFGSIGQSAYRAGGGCPLALRFIFIYSPETGMGGCFAVSCGVKLWMDGCPNKSVPLSVPPTQVGKGA